MSGERGAHGDARRDVGGPTDPEDVMGRFSEATRTWFSSTFAAPTPVQLEAWDAASREEDTLVVAPTGSGKTLAAFLWALDRLMTRPPPEDRRRRCRVLYVSPLKALAVDVRHNLRRPLAGIAAGAPPGAHEVRVAVRTGDTPSHQRRAFLTTPPDILITTPESLFLLLTSRAREALRGVETVVLDEVHVLAGAKRGAHLALSLERLDTLCGRRARRIGLSATVRPVPEVARWLAGAPDRPVRVVAPPSPKVFELQVTVPVPDMADPGTPAEPPPPDGSRNPPQPSLWPWVERRIADLVTHHRSTLVFTNSRRVAERLTARLNELHEERAAGTGADPRPGPGAVAPAQIMGAAGGSLGAAPVLARTHHGSMSKEQRALVEADLRAGRLPAVVATSSLELGIDMGAVDLVVQVASPPSVASGLQRVGRAGHQVGAVSRGVFLPTFRGDLVAAAVVAERMRSGDIEELRIPTNPLDVLAQQIVAMTAMDPWTVEDLESLVRRAAPFSGLTRSLLHAVLDMLAGRYPGDEFAGLRPRLVWDRKADLLHARPGAQSLAVTSGGTIPDRGLYGVFLAGDAGGRHATRRVGELDEEMVHESRVGDVITLGSTSWRIDEITHDRVLVTPTPGVPGRLPFWKGDSPGRPAELGRAVGAFVRETLEVEEGTARDRLSRTGLDAWAADNLLAYLTEQRTATRRVPDDRTIVVEVFRDDVGGWQVVVHSPFGARVNAPWALALGARLHERLGVDVRPVHADDGIVLRLPAGGTGDGGPPRVAELVVLAPEEVEELVTSQLGASSLFAARFRECAARSLLLPRYRPGRRQPLWQQRRRAAQLLAVASRHADFPVVLEAARECLDDVFDVPGLVELMRGVAQRSVEVLQVHTPHPSPFARSLLLGYVGAFLYEEDTPLAERRAATLSLDPTLLAELLGREGEPTWEDLLDPEVVERTESELQWLAPSRNARHAEDVADLLRVLGPLTDAEVLRRSSAGPTDDVTAVTEWLGSLESSGRVMRVPVAGEPRWAVVEDAGRLRDALGTPLPADLPAVLTETTLDPLGDVLARHARTHGPFTCAEVATRLGLGRAVAQEGLRGLVHAGRLVEEPSRGGAERAATRFCDAGVLRVLRRRSLAAARARLAPVPPRALGRFLPEWQEVGGSLRGVDGVLRVVEQLAGALVPASALETLVLPSRVGDYSPAMLDELTAAGEVLWSGCGALGERDGWVSLCPSELAPVCLGAPGGDVPGGDVPGADAPGGGSPPRAELRAAVLSCLEGGGAFFFRPLADTIGCTDDRDLVEVLWQLVWEGVLTNDTLAPLRARLGTAGGGRAREAPVRVRYRAGRPVLRGTARPALPLRSGPSAAAGRWSLLPPHETDPTVRAHAMAELMLERHGVLARGSFTTERFPGGFPAAYRTLRAFEEAGRVRRGYVVDQVGGAQFAVPGAVDRLRAGAAPASSRGSTSPTLVLAAADPANPYGAVLEWPARPEPVAQGHRPGRRAGAAVVLVDGAPVLYVERGGRSVLSWPAGDETLGAAARALAAATRAGALGRVTLERGDGVPLIERAHPVGQALATAGFHVTPRGLRLHPVTPSP